MSVHPIIIHFFKTPNPSESLRDPHLCEEPVGTVFLCRGTQRELQVKTRLFFEGVVFVFCFFFVGKVVWTEQGSANIVLIHRTQHQNESTSEAKSMSRVLLRFLLRLTPGCVFLGQASDSHYVSINGAGLGRAVQHGHTGSHTRT